MKTLSSAKSLPALADTTTSSDTTTRWHYTALGLILLLSAFLNTFNLAKNGYGNTYYAAVVKSMLLNWHNFFFVSFDPSGFVSIDKPPLGFWLQAASAKLFGFTGISLLLPQALAGVGAVALLYFLVRHFSGSLAGLIAALALTLTPLSIVTSRNNTIDSLLVLVLLLATWTMIRATETGRLPWLLLTALLLGLGFNIKMLEAYLVLPAFVALYLFGSSLSWRTRLLSLALACLVLLIVSFSWITIVDLTPASQRPYVGSSQTNSELELALGYNGVSRIIGGYGAPSTKNAFSSQSSVSVGTLSLLFSISENGFPGPLRLVSKQLGGQIGWLLLLAWFALIAVIHKKNSPFVLTLPQRRALLLWGTWFVTLFLFFSVALFGHAYYMVTFAPALCALVGIGIVLMWQEDRARTSWHSWLLPIALLGTALVQFSVLSNYPSWNLWLSPLVVGLCLLASLLLLLAHLRPNVSRTLPKVALTAGLLSLLVAPVVWAALPIEEGNNPIRPLAGPEPELTALSVIVQSFLPQYTTAQPALVHYLQTNQGQTFYLLATVNTSAAAPFILQTGRPAMALGGFSGSDPILTPEQVATLVHTGQVRFFLLPTKLNFQALPPALLKQLAKLGQQLHVGSGNDSSKSSGHNTNSSSSFLQGAVSRWIVNHCTLVLRSQVEPGTTGDPTTVDLGSGPSLVENQLYDCAR